MPAYIFFGLLAAFNFYTFFLMAYDKRAARKKKQRIPEARFFTLGLFGGSLGILFAMPVFRHKNRKWSFKGRIFTIGAGQFFLLVFTWPYISWLFQ